MARSRSDGRRAVLISPRAGLRRTTHGRLPGNGALIVELLADPALAANKRAKQGLTELNLLHEYLEVFGVMSNVREPRGGVDWSCDGWGASNAHAHTANA